MILEMKWKILTKLKINQKIKIITNQKVKQKAKMNAKIIRIQKKIKKIEEKAQTDL